MSTFVQEATYELKPNGQYVFSLKINMDFIEKWPLDAKARQELHDIVEKDVAHITGIPVKLDQLHLQNCHMDTPHYDINLGGGHTVPMRMQTTARIEATAIFNPPGFRAELDHIGDIIAAVLTKKELEEALGDG